ncbi:DUF4230 domain-containing protein [Sphingomonas koreensis]|nr:DUF4230 domain-containing protein [Sphingomonas koreensis]
MIAVVLIALAVAWALYEQQQRVKDAEREAGLASSRVLSAVFTTTSDLKVATLSGEVLAQAHGCSLRCWVPNGQETRAPYSVEYFVHLKGLPASAFRWDAKDRILAVDVPEVQVAAPNIDMSKARTKQSGTWISRDSGIAMQKQAAGYLSTAADTKAKSPENLEKARESARVAIGRFVEAPFAAAGLADVKVMVRLPGDAKPTGMSDEQWDTSRSIADVLAGAR